MKESLLHVEGLVKHFPVTSGVFGRKVGDVRAVDDVSFDIAPGETLGLVGESGCGKTTVGRSVLRLLEPTGGKVVFDDREITHAAERDLKALRRHMQVIFQDPFSSLNPRMRVVDIIGEAMEIHGLTAGRATEDRVVELLRRVGLSPAWINRYPHEFSGGQRQRIGIARAIALEPKLVVCDEAVSALDVSIQAQIINLLVQLRREMNLAYLFIAHDLSVVRHLSHRIAVMYLGEIVELGSARRLFEAPSHPYTRALLSAIPVPDPKRRAHRLVLSGDVPTPRNPPSGCRFHTRCPAVMDRCRAEKPRSFLVEERHHVACLHAEGLESDPAWFSELTRRIDGAISENSKSNANSVAGPDRRARVPEPSRANAAGALTEKNRATLPPRHRTKEDSTRRMLAIGLSVLTTGYVAIGLGGAISGFALCALGYFGFVRKRVASRPLVDSLAMLGFLLATVFSVGLARFERHRSARAEVRELSREITSRAATTGSYPKSLQDLGWRLYRVFDDGRAVDPWGRPFRYRSPGTDGRPFDLETTGPDGIPSDDDIRN